MILKKNLTCPLHINLHKTICRMFFDCLFILILNLTVELSCQWNLSNSLFLEKDKKTIILIVGLILLVAVAIIALLPKHDAKPAKTTDKEPKTLVDAVLEKNNQTKEWMSDYQNQLENLEDKIQKVVHYISEGE